MGESIQLRPSNQSGVVAYLGATQFAPGLWVGVELDTVRMPFSFSFRAWYVGSSYALLGSHCCYSVSYMTTNFSLFSVCSSVFSSGAREARRDGAGGALLLMSSQEGHLRQTQELEGGNCLCGF